LFPALPIAHSAGWPFIVFPGLIGHSTQTDQTTNIGQGQQESNKSVDIFDEKNIKIRRKQWFMVSLIVLYSFVRFH
jgi:hypothetical protein